MILRKINKNLKYFIINVIGLSIALISIIIVFAFVFNEFSYDKFHSKAQRICRITQNTNTGISSMIDARFSSWYYSDLKEKYPEIEKITGITSFRKAIVSINEHAFYTTKAFSVDSSFFKVFDFELIIGNKKTIFNHPKQVAITESLAKTYFGSTNVIGKQLLITHQRSKESKPYTIKAILKDFPKNSHFKADILCSLESEGENNWAYSYMLLKPNVDFLKVQQAIQNDWDVMYKDEDWHPLVDLQALTDIHLHSHKSRELETNGNLSALLLLISGAIIILIIALINFINLNYVQFLSEQKNINIKIVNGASRYHIAIDFFKEIMILLISVYFVSFLILYYLPDFMNYDIFNIKMNIELIMIAVVYVISVIVLAFIPYIFKRRKRNSPLLISNKSYQISFLIQFSLSIIIIISTLIIYQQINYIKFLHPQSQNDDIIVIPRNSNIAVSHFELFKEKLLNHPEIIDVCAVSEEPGGTVTDNFPYTIDGDTNETYQSLNALITDDSFLRFMNIKTLAGTIDLGHIPSYEWNQKAMELDWAENNNYKLPDDFNKEEITSYSEKYIINETALKHMGFKNPQDIIGKRFKLNHPMKYLFPKGTIIGVVEDFHYTNIHIKEKPLIIIPRMLFCHNFLIRFDTNNIQDALSVIKNEWEEVNRGIPFKYEFITDSYAKVYQSEYHQMKVLFLFTIVSILLSMIGLFAMISFKLRLKTKEIGIRKVNGATVFGIVKMLNLDFVKWVLIAFIIAVPIAYYSINKWLENFAYKTPISWWVFIVAGILVLLITLMTVTWQTLKVARRNPVEALRYE